MKIESDHITNENATELLARGLQALRDGATSIDLSAVVRCDSAAVALMLAWRREAQAAGRDLELTGVPSSLCNLAQLYEVDDLVPGVMRREQGHC